MTAAARTAGAMTRRGASVMRRRSSTYNGPMRESRGRSSGAAESMSDNELVRLARQSDVAAEELLVRRHYKTVFNLAYRLCSDYDRAQDIAAEAFIRVHNALPNFRGDANFTTWLYRIVYNVFLDDRKKQRLRTHQSLDEIVDLEDSTVTRQIEDPSPGPQAQIEDTEKGQILRRAVAELSDAQRTMVALYHFQHLSYEEIAEVMHMPIGTVKSRLNRARLALRSKLADSRELLET